MNSGESAHPTKKHLMELAEHFKIKGGAEIIDQVQTVIYNWKQYAKECGVSSDSKRQIQKAIETISR